MNENLKFATLWSKVICYLTLINIPHVQVNQCAGTGVEVSEWNRYFPEFHSEVLGVPREVGLKFWKIGITGKFRSIRPFLLGPSFSEPGNRNSTWLILKLLNIILVLYQTNDWNILLQRYCSGLASQALVSSAKIQSYVKCEHNRSSFETDSWTRQENREVP